MSQFLWGGLLVTITFSRGGVSPNLIYVLKLTFLEGFPKVFVLDWCFNSRSLLFLVYLLPLLKKPPDLLLLPPPRKPPPRNPPPALPLPSTFTTNKIWTNTVKSFTRFHILVLISLKWEFKLLKTYVERKFSGAQCTVLTDTEIFTSLIEAASGSSSVLKL